MTKSIQIQEWRDYSIEEWDEFPETYITVEDFCCSIPAEATDIVIKMLDVPKIEFTFRGSRFMIYEQFQDYEQFSETRAIEEMDARF